MKKSFLVGAGLVLLLSCNQTKDTTSGGTKDHAAIAKHNADNTREIYRAIETGDVSKLDSFIAKDIVDHEGNMGMDIVGADSVKRFISNIHNYFDGLKTQILSEATSMDGNYHFVLVRMTGKTKANPWGMPVGMDMDDTSVDVVKIRDGKATDHWGFTSQKDMMEMMEGMKMNPSQAPMKNTMKSARQ